MPFHATFLRLQLRAIRILLNICIGCFYAMNIYSLIKLASCIDLQESNTFLLIFPVVIFAFALLLYGVVCQCYACMKRNCSQQWSEIISYVTVTSQADINALPTQLFSLATQAVSFGTGFSLMMVKEFWFNSITEHAYLEGLLITGVMLQSIFCVLSGFTPSILDKLHRSLESSNRAEAAGSWAEIL